MIRFAVLALAALSSFLKCERSASDRGDTLQLPPLAASAPPSNQRLEQGPIRMEMLAPDQTPATFVMRGGPRGSGRLVFLHGMCGHALGYAQSFQFSAALKGLLVAPQGDRVCGRGPWAEWSADLNALDARIVAAFRTLGDEPPIEDIVIMGYSQGATRAEALARNWPKRYTRLISMGAPQAPAARGLKALRAAVMMAGELDRKDQMKSGVRSMLAAGIPATFIVIPNATHGAMGSSPEETMGQALDWLWQNSRPSSDAGQNAGN